MDTQTVSANGALSSEHEIKLSDLQTPKDQEAGKRQETKNAGVITECGWFSWRPKFLQRFANPKWLLCILCAYAFFQSMTVNGLVNGSLASLQRRFEFSSFQTGLLPSIYDVTAAVLIVFVGYLGNSANKTRILSVGIICIALGSLVFALPHFTTGVYTYSDNNASDVCSPSAEHITMVHDAEKTTIASLSGYLYVFILSQMVFALGGAPVYSLGFAFIDESVRSKDAGVYLGILITFVTLGPAVGFVVGGVLLSLNTDFYSSSISPTADSSDVQWVGAWWLGFVVCAIISFMIALPLTCFPQELAGTQAIRKERESQAHASSDIKLKADRDGFGSSWRDFPSATKILFRNPTFVLLTLGIAADNIFATGAEVFLPIYLENQFGLSSGNANIIVGILVCVAGGGALLVGGWLVKRLNLKVPGMLKFIIVANIINGLSLCSGFLRCPEIPLAGVYQQYADESASSSVVLNDTCNTGCHCSTAEYSPVCGSNEVMYFSPCFAGCQSQEDEDSVMYSNCTCLTHYSMMNDSSLVSATAVPGRCGSYCSEMYIFIAFLFLILVSLFIDKVAATNTILRCVPDGQQSFALGVYGLMTRVFGSLPGPIIFGSLIDSTCTLWHEENGERGQCWFHDRTDLSLKVVILGVSVKLLTLVFVSLAYKTYKPPQPPQPPQPEDKV